MCTLRYPYTLHKINGRNMSTYLKPSERDKLEAKLQQLEKKYDGSLNYRAEAMKDAAIVDKLLSGGVIDREHAYILRKQIRDRVKDIEDHNERVRNRQTFDEQNRKAASWFVFFVILAVVLLLASCS